MPTLLKHHRKRLILSRITDYVRRKRMILATQSFQMNDNQAEDYQDQEDFPLQPAPDISFEDLPMMSRQERQRLQQQYTNLPPYIFMTHKQKVAFFKKKTEQFNKKINQTPQRESKTKKIVKFQKNFQVRPFRHVQTAHQIRKTKSFSDSYKPYHFS